MTEDLHNRWLLLALQLPAQPSNARVKTWRRLQQLGAVSVKNSVYVLPNSAQAIEDFEWLRSEIQGMKGQASIFTAASVDGLEEREIVEQFRQARTEQYRQFRRELAQLRSRGRHGRGTDRLRDIRQLRDRLTEIRQIDFFSAPGADEAERELGALERAHSRLHKQEAAPAAVVDRKDYKRRTWVTRPRPGVDRFASAWLIQRFIDAEARFVFAADAADAGDAIPFDMYSGGFRHERDLCTFEVLHDRFGITEPVVRRIGEIVHDIDLKEDRYRAPQTAAVAALVDGLRATFADDAELLKQGIVMFEALYRGLDERKSRRAAPSTRSKSQKSGGRK
jgi:hypothetical protein